MFLILFYSLAVVILSATVLAVTRRNLVHAVLYLVLSFFGSAMLLYLFGAPFLAAMEIIIYAGAVMVLFLFVIMMIDMSHLPEVLFPVSQLIPALVIVGAYMAAGALMLAGDPVAGRRLSPAAVAPGTFGEYVMTHHWLPVEVVSLLLLVVLLGALHLGRPRPDNENGGEPERG